MAPKKNSSNSGSGAAAAGTASAVADDSPSLRCHVFVRSVDATIPLSPAEWSFVHDSPILAGDNLSLSPSPADAAPDSSCSGNLHFSGVLIPTASKSSSSSGAPGKGSGAGGKGAKTGVLASTSSTAAEVLRVLGGADVAAMQASYLTVTCSFAPDETSDHRSGPVTRTLGLQVLRPLVSGGTKEARATMHIPHPKGSSTPLAANKHPFSTPQIIIPSDPHPASETLFGGNKSADAGSSTMSGDECAAYRWLPADVIERRVVRGESESERGGESAGVREREIEVEIRVVVECVQPLVTADLARSLRPVLFNLHTLHGLPHNPHSTPKTPNHPFVTDCWPIAVRIAVTGKQFPPFFIDQACRIPGNYGNKAGKVVVDWDVIQLYGDCTASEVMLEVHVWDREPFIIISPAAVKQLHDDSGKGGGDSGESAKAEESAAAEVKPSKGKSGAAGKKAAKKKEEKKEDPKKKGQGKASQPASDPSSTPSTATPSHPPINPSLLYEAAATIRATLRIPHAIASIRLPLPTIQFITRPGDPEQGLIARGEKNEVGDVVRSEKDHAGFIARATSVEMRLGVWRGDRDRRVGERGVVGDRGGGDEDGGEVGALMRSIRSQVRLGTRSTGPGQAGATASAAASVQYWQTTASHYTESESRLKGSWTPLLPPPKPLTPSPDDADDTRSTAAPPSPPIWLVVATGPYATPKPFMHYLFHDLLCKREDEITVQLKQSREECEALTAELENIAREVRALEEESAMTSSGAAGGGGSKKKKDEKDKEKERERERERESARVTARGDLEARQTSADFRLRTARARIVSLSLSRVSAVEVIDPHRRWWFIETGSCDRALELAHALSRPTDVTNDGWHCAFDAGLACARRRFAMGVSRYRLRDGVRDLLDGVKLHTRAVQSAIPHQQPAGIVGIENRDERSGLLIVPVDSAEPSLPPLDHPSPPLAVEPPPLAAPSPSGKGVAKGSSKSNVLAKGSSKSEGVAAAAAAAAQGVDAEGVDRKGVDAEGVARGLSLPHTLQQLHALSLSLSLSEPLRLSVVLGCRWVPGVASLEEMARCVGCRLSEEDKEGVDVVESPEEREREGERADTGTPIPPSTDHGLDLRSWTPSTPTLASTLLHHTPPHTPIWAILRLRPVVRTDGQTSGDAGHDDILQQSATSTVTGKKRGIKSKRKPVMWAEIVPHVLHVVVTGESVMDDLQKYVGVCVEVRGELKLIESEEIQRDIQSDPTLRPLDPELRTGAWSLSLFQFHTLSHSRIDARNLPFVRSRLAAHHRSRQTNYLERNARTVHETSRENIQRRVVQSAEAGAGYRRTYASALDETLQSAGAPVPVPEAERERERKWRERERGWVTTGAVRHRTDVSDARKTELAEKWIDPVEKENERRRREISVENGLQRFDATPVRTGYFERDPQYFRSIFESGDGLEAEEKMRRERESEDWRSKVVVEDTSFKIQWRPVEKGMLSDPPSRCGLRTKKGEPFAGTAMLPSSSEAWVDPHRRPWLHTLHTETMARSGLTVVVGREEREKSAAPLHIPSSRSTSPLSRSLLLEKYGAARYGNITREEKQGFRWFKDVE